MLYKDIRKTYILEKYIYFIEKISQKHWSFYKEVLRERAAPAFAFSQVRYIVKPSNFLIKDREFEIYYFTSNFSCILIY